MIRSSGRKRPEILAAAFEVLESRQLLASTVLTANTADAQVLDTGAIGSTTGTTVRVGDNGTNATETNYVIPFQLPSLPAGAVINSVTANFNLESIANGSSIAGSLDLYGLGRRASATVLTSDYYMGAYSGDATDATAIQTAFATKTSTIGSVTPSSAGVTALTNYLNAQYAYGAGAGQYVFLRLSPQAVQLTSRYWVFSTANHATVANRPTLTVDYTVASPPAAPSNLTPVPTSESTVKLDWTDQSNNETGFSIERSTNGTIWFPAGSVGANVATFTDTGRTADTKYLYRVYATGSGGNSGYSNSVTTATLPDFIADTVWVDASYAGTTQNGAFATPFKSMSAALNATTTGSGDGVVVRGGTYKDYVNMKPGVTLMGTPYERVVNSGFTSLTNWTAVSGSPGVYQTTLASNPSALYVGYEQMNLAKSPNEGWWTGASIVNNGTASHTLTDAAHLAGIPSLVGAQIMVHNSNSNTWPVKTITAHDAVNGTITFDHVGGTAGLAPNEYYMVRGKTQLIDYDREWAVVDNGNATWTVFFRPGPEDISKTQVRTGGTIIKFDADHGASVRNIEVTGSAGTNPNDEGILVTNSNNVTVSNNVIHNNAGIGISATGSDYLIARNNTVYNNGDSGISASNGSDFALIENNDVGFNAQDAVRVAHDSDDGIVRNNYLHDSFGFTHPDGVQTFSSSGTTVDRVKIIGNFIVRSGQGIILQSTNDAEISNNVILHTTGYQILPSATGQVIKNNTQAGSGIAAVYPTTFAYTFNENVLSIRQLVQSVSVYTGDRNLFFSPISGQAPLRLGTNQNHTSIATWNAATGQDANSQIGNPLFNYTFLAATAFSSTNLTLNTTTKIYVDSTTGFNVGDKIQVNGDGVARTVTAVGGGAITFAEALPHIPLSPYGVIENFGTSTNMSPDLRLSASSPGKTMSSTGGPIGSLINNVQYALGDFTGDNVRDVPNVPLDVLAGLDPTI